MAKNAVMLTEDNSQPVHVAAAVAIQLHAEFHWPPNDLKKVMESDYRYNQTTITLFLEAVRIRLTHATPPLKFTFDNKFCKAALPMRVIDIMAAINAKTAP